MSKKKVQTKNKIQKSVESLYDKNVEEKELEEEVVIKPTEKKYTVGKLIFNIVFWVAFVGLLTLWITEIVVAENGKDPILCFNEEIHQFDDGTVRECHGIGYKTFEYHRESINITRQFGAFFVEMRK